MIKVQTTKHLTWVSFKSDLTDTVVAAISVYAIGVGLTLLPSLRAFIQISAACVYDTNEVQTLITTISFLSSPRNILCAVYPELHSHVSPLVSSSLLTQVLCFPQYSTPSNSWSSWQEGLHQPHLPWGNEE